MNKISGLVGSAVLEVIGLTSIRCINPRLEAQIEQVKSRQEQCLWPVNLYIVYSIDGCTAG